VSRGVSGGFNTATAAAHVVQFPLVEMQLASGTLFVCGAAHDVPWNGNTYLSARGLGQIDEIEETESEIRGLAFTLQGVTPDIISLAMSDQSQGRPVIVRWAVLNGATLEVDANVWTGRIDLMQIVDGPTPSVRVTAEHRLVAWQTPQPVRFSDADQQRLAPGDRFFEHAEATSNAVLVWPSKQFFER
jgi:hypothetical protein